MCGGEPQAYAEAEPVIDAYARVCRLMGPPGSGQLTKMVSQICIAGLVQGLAEGIHFAKKTGLDVEAAIQVISKGAAQSWQMENRAGTMIKGQFDFGFAVDWMRKDLSICLDEARRTGANLPATAVVDQFYSVQFRGAEDRRPALGYFQLDRAAGKIVQRAGAWAAALDRRNCSVACVSTSNSSASQSISRTTTP